MFYRYIHTYTYIHIKCIFISKITFCWYGIRQFSMRQNLRWFGKLSFFIICKFWQNCALVRQVSDYILKTANVDGLLPEGLIPLLIQKWFHVNKIFWNHHNKSPMVITLWPIMNSWTCWIVLKIIKDIFTFWIVSWIYLDPGRWNYNSGTTINAVCPTQSIPCLLMLWRL